MEKLFNFIPHFLLKQVLSSTLPFRNIALSYKILGGGTSDPPKPPIFIFHGLIGSKKQWEGIGKTILNMTRSTVVAVDLRNHGNSPHANSHKYTEQATDVIELLDKLGAKQASLIGYSMGGRTAMCVALMAPHKVAGLLIVDMSPVSTAQVFREYRSKVLVHMKAVDFKKPKLISIARAEARAQLKGFISDEYVMRTILDNVGLRPGGSIGWICNLDVIMKEYKYWISFPRLLKKKSYSGPTLFIGGQLSEFIPADDLIKIRGIFPQAVVIYIPKAGHKVHIDDPKTFLERTISFLKTIVE